MVDQPSDPNILRKKMRWMAKKRGWVEMEVLLGAFYEDYIEEMSDEELPSFARILQCDDAVSCANDRGECGHRRSWTIALSESFAHTPNAVISTYFVAEAGLNERYMDNESKVSRSARALRRLRASSPCRYRDIPSRTLR